MSKLVIAERLHAIPDRTIRRALIWYQSYGYRGLDLLLVPLCLTSAFAITQITDAQRQTFITYRRMADIAPFRAWELFLVAIALGIVLGMHTPQHIGAKIACLASAFVWLVLGWLIWSGSHTYLTPSWCGIFAIVSFYRYAQLSYEAANRE